MVYVQRLEGRQVKTETRKLEGAALDWAVMKCEHPANESVEFFNKLRNEHALLGSRTGRFRYSERWDQGGPIIERERIQIRPMRGNEWDAYAGQFCGEGRGPAPLIAAMRCYVASKLGEEVDIPDELMEGGK